MVRRYEMDATRIFRCASTSRMKGPLLRSRINLNQTKQQKAAVDSVDIPFSGEVYEIQATARHLLDDRFTKIKDLF